MSDREVSCGRSRTRSESSHKSVSPKRSESRKCSRSASKTPRSRSRSRGSYHRRSRSRSHRKRHSKSRSRSNRRYRTRSRSASYDHKRSSKYDKHDRHDRDRSSRSSRQYSGSRSPMSSRRRHQGDRSLFQDNPRKSRCLGVFGLNLHTKERALRDVFEQYGPIDDLQIVYDHQSGRSRGFGFVYMKYLEDAIEAKEKATGLQLDGRNIRIDFSITERAHTPTPGVYLGRTSGGVTRYGRGSPSPYNKRGGRYSRSRSRSRSNSRRRY